MAQPVMRSPLLVPPLLEGLVEFGDDHEHEHRQREEVGPLVGERGKGGGSVRSIASSLASKSSSTLFLGRLWRSIDLRRCSTGTTRWSDGPPWYSLCFRASKLYRASSRLCRTASPIRVSISASSDSEPERTGSRMIGVAISVLFCSNKKGTVFR